MTSSDSPKRPCPGPEPELLTTPRNAPRGKRQHPRGRDPAAVCREHLCFFVGSTARPPLGAQTECARERTGRAPPTTTLGQPPTSTTHKRHRKKTIVRRAAPQSAARSPYTAASRGRRGTKSTGARREHILTPAIHARTPIRSLHPHTALASEEQASPCAWSASLRARRQSLAAESPPSLPLRTEGCPTTRHAQR